jgi:4-amino-4-deoxy-L-arabinose transferase-like glycosyltransferase
MHANAPAEPIPHLRLLLPAVALWHLVSWMLAPALVYASLPLDTLELLGWGQEWQWGYYKHPPLAPWLGEAWLRLFAGQLDSLYLLAQACVLLTLLYVWRCARLWLDPARAVLATVLLEGSYFHTLLSTNFNINLLQLPLWAGLCFHFLRALQGARWHWLACALLAALCLLTKYSGALLCLSCAAVMFATPAGRSALRTPWPWLAAALALLLLAPHLAWLRDQGYLPLRYLRGFERQAPDSLAMHVVEPLRFAAGALLGMVFSLLLFFTLRDRGAARPAPHPWTPVLLLLCFGPLLLAVAYGFWTGSRLKSTWGFPFFNLIGIVLFVLLPTRIGRRHLQRFTLALAAVALLFGASHLAYKLASSRSKTAFDGQALALAATRVWEARSGTPLRIVAGNHVLSAIVSSYGPSRPSMLVDGDFELSPWVTPADVRRDGVLVICEQAEEAAPCAAAAALLPHAATEPERVTLAGRSFLLHVSPPAGKASARPPLRRFATP